MAGLWMALIAIEIQQSKLGNIGNIWIQSRELDHYELGH